MAGVDVGGGGRKRALNADINMIPFIDLLMVTVAFLLITAVWVTNSQITANAQVPGDPGPVPDAIDRTLHLHVEPEAYRFTWKENNVVVSEGHLLKNEGDKSLSALRERITSEYKERGRHSAAHDLETDRLILHTDDRLPYGELAAVMDAVAGTKREMRLGERVAMVPAFSTTFAVR